MLLLIASFCDGNYVYMCTRNTLFILNFFFQFFQFLFFSFFFLGHTKLKYTTAKQHPTKIQTNTTTKAHTAFPGTPIPTQYSPKMLQSTETPPPSPPAPDRRPSIVDSLSSILYYVTDSVAPYPPSHVGDFKANDEITDHIDNVLSTVINHIAPETIDQGLSSQQQQQPTTSIAQRLFATTTLEEDQLLQADTKMRSSVFNAVVDTRTYEIEYSLKNFEANNFIDEFYKLLAKDNSKWTEQDWTTIDSMFELDENLLWRRCVKRHASKCFEETYSTLHCAAAVGNYRLCESIITKAPLVIDVVDKYGRQPLHIAAYWGHADIVDLLTQWLIEITKKSPTGKDAPIDIVGWTPSIWASRGSKERVDNKQLTSKFSKKTIEELELEMTLVENEISTAKSKYKTKEFTLAETRALQVPAEAKIKNLQATMKYKKFGRCRDILYAHGDRHISPKKQNLLTTTPNRDSPLRSNAIERLGDTPNRTKLERDPNGTPLRMDTTLVVDGEKGDSLKNNTPRTGIMSVTEVIERSKRSSLIHGCASHHMTGFRSTNEDSVVVHFDEDWVRLTIFFILF